MDSLATLESIRTGPTGLEISGPISFDDWSAIGGRFGTALQSAAWCIGDWLVYGQDHFGRVPSAAYDAALVSTGLDRATLKSYASVCRSIPHGQRNPVLTFGHHRDLAALPEKDRAAWVEVATAQPCAPSVKRLRLSVRIAGDGPPHIVTDAEIMARGEHAGHDNYIPHLTRLLTVLRRTVPGMTERQRQALADDTEQLVELLLSVRRP